MRGLAALGAPPQQGLDIGGRHCGRVLLLGEALRARGIVALVHVRCAPSREPDKKSAHLLCQRNSTDLTHTHTHTRNAATTRIPKRQYHNRMPNGIACGKGSKAHRDEHASDPKLPCAQRGRHASSFARGGGPSDQGRESGRQRQGVGGGGECAGCVARRGTLSMLEGGHPPTATPDLAPECAACSARHASEYTKRFARARARRSRAHALACARNILCDLGAHLDSASSPKSLRACCVAPRSMDGLASGGGFDLGQRPRLCHRRISPRAVA